MKRLMAADMEPVNMVNRVTTPATAPYTPKSSVPNARSTTREVISPTTSNTNIRKYRRTVFLAILLLLSDMPVRFGMIRCPIGSSMTSWPAPAGHLYSGL